MNFELVFSLVNISVMPAWILLMFAPNWRFTDRIAHTALMPLLLALAYIYFLAWGIFFGGSADGAGMGSLAAVTTLFSSPVSLLGGFFCVKKANSFYVGGVLIM